MEGTEGDCVGHLLKVEGNVGLEIFIECKKF